MPHGSQVEKSPQGAGRNIPFIGKQALGSHLYVKGAGKDSDAKVGSEWLQWLEMSLKGTIHPVSVYQKHLIKPGAYQSNSILLLGTEGFVI